MFCRTAEVNTCCAADRSGWFSAAMAPFFPIFADIAEAVSILLFRVSALVVRLCLRVRISVLVPTEAEAYRKG